VRLEGLLLNIPVGAVYDRAYKEAAQFINSERNPPECYASAMRRHLSKEGLVRGESRMKRFSFLAIPTIAVSVLVIFGQQPSPAVQTGTIRGVVVRAGTQDPIKDVQVVVGSGAGRPTPAPARSPIPPPAVAPSTLSAISDSAGRVRH
jgi:hypothetical protein